MRLTLDTGSALKLSQPVSSERAEALLKQRLLCRSSLLFSAARET